MKTKTNDSKAWMSVNGVAEFLDVSKETIYWLIHRKKIPKHRIGKLWRFNKKEITLWMMKK